MEEKLEKILQKGNSLLEKNKPLEAVLILKKAVKEFSGFSYAHYLLGIARIKCGLFCLAVKSFEEADRLFPNDSENFRSLGWAKIMLGKIEEGRNDLRNSINLDLTNANAYTDLAMSYFKSFDFEEGFAWIERAKSLDPKNEFILDTYEMGKSFEKNFSKFSEKDKKQAKKENLNPEKLKKEHFLILKNTFMGREFNREEALELEKEMELSGLIKGFF